MKILLNASMPNGSGSVQVACSLIRHALDDDRGHVWRFAVSKEVDQDLKQAGVTSEPPVIPILGRPGSPWRGRGARRALLRLEEEFDPHVTFTVVGPAYVRFRKPHLCGCALPWMTHPSRLAYSQLTIRRALWVRLMRLKNIYYFRRCHYFWTETETSKRGMVQALRRDPDTIRVVPNTYSQLFDSVVPNVADFSQSIRLLTVAGAMRHKNLDIIPDVLVALGRLAPRRRFEFTVNLPSQHPITRNLVAKAQRLRVGDRLHNVGYVPVTDFVALYERHDLVFMPTLLETFSATYPEAMRMDRPIITTDLDFAHDVCQDAAAYYAPLDPDDAAKRILEVSGDATLRKRLIEKGHSRLLEFPSSFERYSRLVEFLEQISREAGS